jgi:transposase-like protein
MTRDKPPRQIHLSRREICPNKRSHPTPADAHLVIHSTDAGASLHVQLRIAIKARGLFSGDDTGINLMWLTVRNMLADRLRSG